MEFFEVTEKYLKYCQFERATPVARQTLHGYIDVIKILNKSLGNILIDEMKLEDVLDIKRQMIERGNSIGYIHKTLCIIRSILKYAEEQLELQVFPISKIKLPNPKKRDVEYLMPDDLTQIYGAIDQNSPWGIRLMAFLACLLDSGLRISELISLNKRDIDFQNASAWVIGKGSKKRLVFFRAWSLGLLLKYLQMRNDDNEALFVNLDDQRNRHEIYRIRPDSIREYFRLIAKKTGIQKFQPHTLRRTFATWLYHAGTDIRILKDLLGHSSIKFTEMYVGVDTEMLRRIHGQNLSYGEVEKIGLEDRDKILNDYLKNLVSS